jgi:hypothetical protein
MPAERLTPADYLNIDGALEETAIVLEGTGLEPALYGDSYEAIGLVLALLPIKAVDLKTDIIMTSVLRCTSLR